MPERGVRTSFDKYNKRQTYRHQKNVSSGGLTGGFFLGVNEGGFSERLTSGGF